MLDSADPLPSFRGRHVLAWLFLVAATLAAALALVGAAAGGFRTDVLGLTLSVRSANRAAWVAILTSTIGVLLHRGIVQRLARTLDRVPHTIFPIGAAIAAVALFWIGLQWGPRGIGTSDVYGYVSQAELWRSGTLRVHQPLAASAPWPNADWTLSPLGYRPAENHTLVPTYAPGVPLLIALFQIVFGSGGELLVTPLCAAAAVALTYLLGGRQFGRPVGFVAAATVASSPIVLMMTCWLLGDLPAVPFWLGAVLLALRQTASTSAAAGVMAGVALLIRPNLLPLLVPVAAAAAAPSADEARWRLRRAGMVLIGCAPAAAFIGYVFTDLYGSPLRSGYGDTAGLFTFRNIPINTAHFTRWLYESQGPFWLAAGASVLYAVRGAGRGRHSRMALLALVVVTLGCYVAYITFEAWWFLRFLLPALPAVFILAADGVWLLAAQYTPAARAVLVTAFTVLTVGYGITEAFDRNVFMIGRREQRYADVGDFIKQGLPRNAVFFTLQHSGAIRYNTGAMTIRYDQLDPQWLDRAVNWLRDRGYEPYFVLDVEEVPDVRTRFAGQTMVDALQVLPADNPDSHAIVLYPVGRPSTITEPMRIPSLAR